MSSLLNPFLNVPAATGQTQGSDQNVQPLPGVLGGDIPNRIGGINDPLPSLLPLPPFTSNTETHSTVRLTTSSVTPSSTSSSAQVSQSSSLSTSSAESSSAASPSAGSSQASSSEPTAVTFTSSDAFSTPPPSVTQTLLPSSGSSSQSSNAANPSGSATTDAAHAAPKSFLENKPLSISVIVVASLLGLIFLIIIGTWAVRRRRRDKLHNLAAELSSDNLVRPGFRDGGSSLGHGSTTTDVEKGGFSTDVIDKVEAIGGARTEGLGYGGAIATMAGAAQRGSTQRSGTRMDYGQPSYQATRAVAAQESYAQRGYPQARGAGQDYNQPAAAPQNPSYQQAIVASPGQPYPQVMTYAGPYAQAQPGATPTYLSPNGTSPTRNVRESYQSAHNLPNPFENSGPNAVLAGAAAYDLSLNALPTTQFTISRQIQRKPAPPLLTLDTSFNVGAHVQQQPMSAGSLSGAPMMPTDMTHSARPTGEGIIESPLPPRRTSLLNAPRSPTTPKTSTHGHHRKGSDGKRPSFARSPGLSVLDPGPPPPGPHLPDEFGSSASFPDSARVLKIVNP